jgi:hypothetical protein
VSPPYPSGSWSGFYMQGRRRSRMWLGLTFEGGRVGGAGSDPVGSFIVTGSYDDSGAVTFLKQYVGGHEVDYRGLPSGKGIAGSWTIPPHLTGLFRIWPRSEGEDEELVEEVPLEAPVVEESAQPS